MLNNCSHILQVVTISSGIQIGGSRRLVAVEDDGPEFVASIGKRDATYELVGSVFGNMNGVIKQFCSSTVVAVELVNCDC